MAATSTHPEWSRSGSALDDSHRLTERMRPPAVPAYYMGRPAWMWIARFRRTSQGRPRTALDDSLSRHDPIEEHP